MTVEILDLAKQDLLDGYRFYERQEKGLGRYFLVSVYSDIESLKLFGGVHAKVHKRFHRALSKRFPFAVYYTVEGDGVKIHAIVDCRAAPSWIRSHLEKNRRKG